MAYLKKQARLWTEVDYVYIYNKITLFFIENVSYWYWMWNSSEFLCSRQFSIWNCALYLDFAAVEVSPILLKTGVDSSWSAATGLIGCVCWCGQAERQVPILHCNPCWIFSRLGAFSARAGGSQPGRYHIAHAGKTPILSLPLANELVDRMETPKALFWKGLCEHRPPPSVELRCFSHFQLRTADAVSLESSVDFPAQRTIPDA